MKGEGGEGRERVYDGAENACDVCGVRGARPSTKPSTPTIALSQPLRFIIPSVLAEGRAVQDQIMDEVKRQGYGEDSTFAIHIALEEGIINAIKHGNKLDPKKTVTVEAQVTKEKFVVTLALCKSHPETLRRMAFGTRPASASPPTG